MTYNNIDILWRETWRREVDDDLGRCCHLSTRALNSTKVGDASQSWSCPSPRINVRGRICRILSVPIYKGGRKRRGSQASEEAEERRRGEATHALRLSVDVEEGYDDKTEDHAWSVVEEDRRRKQRRQVMHGDMECGGR